MEGSFKGMFGPVALSLLVTISLSCAEGDWTANSQVAIEPKVAHKTQVFLLVNKNSPTNATANDVNDDE